ncbi:GIY-YIG nuclease family protein [Sphingomonas sp. LT1P40]|uniref:GIY-YIG nuclease family protein n=1 Tax=Alteristakelama amylovorans TaxID=3096166 RepID=UPI002FCC98CB
MPKRPCVYILASQPMGTLYIGVTAYLLARLYQHRSGEIPGFTSNHHVHMLVRYEFFATMPEAIAREKQLKRWHRQWKINLIETDNPQWIDLAVGLGLEPLPPGARRSGC